MTISQISVRLGCSFTAFRTIFSHSCPLGVVIKVNKTVKQEDKNAEELLKCFFKFSEMFTTNAATFNNFPKGKTVHLALSYNSILLPLSWVHFSHNGYQLKTKWYIHAILVIWSPVRKCVSFTWTWKPIVLDCTMNRFDRWSFLGLLRLWDKCWHL